MTVDLHSPEECRLAWRLRYVHALLVRAEDLAVESIAIERAIERLGWWEIRARMRAINRMETLTYLRLAVLSEVIGAMREHGL